jgi:hypothetical protein
MNNLDLQSSTNPSDLVILFTSSMHVHLSSTIAECTLTIHVPLKRSTSLKTTLSSSAHFVTKSNSNVLKIFNMFQIFPRKIRFFVPSKLFGKCKYTFHDFQAVKGLSKRSLEAENTSFQKGNMKLRRKPKGDRVGSRPP